MPLLRLFMEHVPVTELFWLLPSAVRARNLGWLIRGWVLCRWHVPITRCLILVCTWICTTNSSMKNGWSWTVWAFTKDTWRSRKNRLNINRLSIMTKFSWQAVPIGWMQWCATVIRSNTIFPWMVVRRKPVIWLPSTIWIKKVLWRIMALAVFPLVWIWIRNWMNTFLSDWLPHTHRTDTIMFPWAMDRMNILACWPVPFNPIPLFLFMMRKETIISIQNDRL